MPTHLTSIARSLRRKSTDAESYLWRRVRSRQIACLRFRRQQPIGPYIVDFYCFEKKLIIEIDGGQHFESEADRRRDRWLAARWYLVLRFWNHEVLEQTMAVLDRIEEIAALR
jgi:very-short-patch-repair endonuclease